MMCDVYNGKLYKELLTKDTVYCGDHLGHKHFLHATDIALGFWVDSFQLFKQGSNDCWPLLTINYNLPPAEQFLKDNVWLLTIIPGLKALKDINSFLKVFILEMGDLMRGEPNQWDAHCKQRFTLQAYLLLVGRDMPAVLKLMNFKGHQGVSPCQVWQIYRCYIPNANNHGGCHYYPLTLLRDWDGRSKLCAACGADYNPSCLPMHNHTSYQKHVNLLQTVLNPEDVRQGYSINIDSIFSCLSSINFPRLFPLGYAHLIFLNTILNIVQHTKGTLSKWVPSTGKPYYAVPKAKWEQLTKALGTATSTVPALYSQHFHNILHKFGMMVAEDWLNFLLFASCPLFAMIYTSPDQAECLELWNLLAKAVKDCTLLSFPQSSIVHVQDWLVCFVQLYEKSVLSVFSNLWKLANIQLGSTTTKKTWLIL
jgi:hypothetical protein